MKVKLFEEQFKKRYNRDVEVDVENEYKDKILIRSKVIIKYKDKEFTLEEHLKDQLTDFVYVEINGKTYKYKTYLESEVSIADAISEV